MDKNHAEIINFYLQKNIFRDIILKKFYKKQGLTKITAENIILSKQASKQAIICSALYNFKGFL